MLDSRYSFFDRLIHRIAFNTQSAQVALADVEDIMLGKKLTAITPERPVFITALPRAGTTLLLELLAELDEFASHRYRDMPFLLMPSVWNRFASRHRHVRDACERAHGDGMKIDTNSPEALEELIWKLFWKKHYSANCIELWDDQTDEEFTSFFLNHMRKMMLARSPDDSGQNIRYVSKNNPNIARIRQLKTMFPDSTVLVPFRDPVQHAISLHRQHCNFLKLQKEDRFVLEYMTAIGHHDFGEKLLPINFDNWLHEDDVPDPEQLEFWLHYWVKAYGFLRREHATDVQFVCYENICESEATLKRLAEKLELAESESLTSQWQGLHAPARRLPPEDSLTPDLVAQANEVHEQLLVLGC